MLEDDQFLGRRSSPPILDQLLSEPVSNKVVGMWKKMESLEELEEMNLSLRTENVELRRMPEVAEEKKRH